MNPYLENPSVWRDFQTNFLVQLQTMLVPLVGPKYVVALEVRLNLHERSAEERRVFGIADVAVPTDTSRRSATSAVLLDAPMYPVLSAIELQKHRYLEIRDSDEKRVITVIELLSPSNKATSGDGDDYQIKRLELLRTDASLVEIDLLRAGKRTASPDIPACDYCVFVSRPSDRPRVAFWPIGLRDRLPVIPIPRGPNDEPVMIDLKAVLDRSYDSAGYANRIYERPPEPPLSSEDDAWARGLAGLLV